MMRLLLLIAILTIPSWVLGMETVEQWGLYEVTLSGPADGNPFVESRLSATFAAQHKTMSVGGFYDREGIYRIRFMPDNTGTWEYDTKSNVPRLNWGKLSGEEELRRHLTATIQGVYATHGESWGPANYSWKGGSPSRSSFERVSWLAKEIFTSDQKPIPSTLTNVDKQSARAGMNTICITSVATR
ncbi:DUF5060 domain-containing protein, partial [Candidatus Sumerlaeota bacterium]